LSFLLPTLAGRFEALFAWYDCWELPMKEVGVEDAELLVDIGEKTAVLTLNRPQRLNALSTSLLVQLAKTFSDLGSNGELRCVILKGAGEKAFCAGMDLASLAANMPEELLDQIAAKGPLQHVMEAMENCPLPIIGMIGGYALGAGCELALGCDLRIGSPDTTMGMPPARLGIVYAPEGLARFIRTIGVAQTKKLFLTARYLVGREAYEMGLLHYLVDHDELEEATKGLAEDIAARAPLAVAGLKRSLNILGLHAEPSEAEQAEISALIERAAVSHDAVEGLAAFTEKRTPQFRGE
jgi:enoyl-CoA hydratase/carnithine racemase